MLTPADPNREPSPASAPTAEQVFLEHAPGGYHLARWILGNKEDAEDVMQRVLLQVVRKLPTFRGESALSTWLNHIAVREALAFRRRRAARREHEVPQPAGFAEDGSRARAAQRWRGPAAEVINREARQQLERAIARLPEKYRDVLVLADVEGAHNDDVAKRLGLSLAAVKSRLRRARLMMRESLAPYLKGEVR
jgi:RNA polymerase sigma-70 factor (ECF subfamily)